MRYKKLSLALVILLATPSNFSAQELSPIIVYTGKPTPSVVKTGEVFRVNYRVEFLNTVLIYEEQMKPDSLALDKVEAVGLQVNKTSLQDDKLGSKNVWDFVYTFRIIDPEKGEKKIPPFNFLWHEKRAGMTDEQAREKESPKEFPTEEVIVTYVSSIVTPPPLDIRDEINFEPFGFSGQKLRQFGYSTLGLSVVVTFMIVVSFLRSPKSKSIRKLKQEIVLAEGGVFTDPIDWSLTPEQARKNFLEQLYRCRDVNSLRLKVRTLLFIELLDMGVPVSSSDTPRDILNRLSALEPSQKNRMGNNFFWLKNLTAKFDSYNKDWESRTLLTDLEKESSELTDLVRNIVHKSRFSAFLERFRRVKNV